MDRIRVFAAESPGGHVGWYEVDRELFSSWIAAPKVRKTGSVIV